MKKGDRVLVWSLQSFHKGGFLNGEPAFVRQSTSSDSVIVSVIRNFDGVYRIDASYEVYIRQVEKVAKDLWPAKRELRKYRKKVIADTAIS